MKKWNVYRGVALLGFVIAKDPAKALIAARNEFGEWSDIYVRQAPSFKAQA